MIIATPLLGQRSLPPYPPWSLCSVSIRSHWGCFSSHFTFLSLSAAAKLLGFLFLWASDITAAFELQQRSAASVPFLLIHLLYTHLLSFFFFCLHGNWVSAVGPMSRKRCINYLELGLVQVIMHVTLATLSEVLCLVCSTSPCSILGRRVFSQSAISCY